MSNLSLSLSPLEVTEMAVRLAAFLSKPKPFFKSLLFFSSQLDPTNAICRVLSDNRAPHHDLSSSLHPFSSSLSSDPDLITSIFLRTAHLHLPSLRFFLFLSGLPSPSPLTPQHFSLLFSSLSKSPSLLPHFNSLLSSYPSLVSPPLFHHIFSAYARYKLPSDAIRVFNLMGDLGFKPSLTDLHSLFLSLCKYSFVSEAEQFFHEIKPQFDITVQTYTILINGWGRIRDSKRALKLFDEMLEGKFQPDLPAYNSLIASLCRSGQVGPAQEMLKELQLVHKLVPNAATYSSFLRTATEAKELNSAIRALDRMKRRGLIPNTFTYNTILKLLCENEQTEDAYKLLDEMLLNDSNSKPDIWSYNSILAIHCKLKETNKALKLIERMDKDSCSPDQHSYNMLLKTLIHVGRIDEANEIFEGMEKRRFYPPCSCYAVMIHGLCRKKGRADLEMACGYFERMVEEGIPPYVSTCEVLRERLLRERMGEKVEIVLDRMRRSSSCAIRELCSVMSGTNKELRNGEKSNNEFEFPVIDSFDS
ncbi:hypothetical protein LUZ60_008943 [Juncus effusus]|nr:hypothetical protein LUZ60_008943 [Juncus effusus]